jgi:hypothetical protein
MYLYVCMSVDEVSVDADTHDVISMRMQLILKLWEKMQLIVKLGGCHTPLVLAKSVNLSVIHTVFFLSQGITFTLILFCCKT